MSGTEDRLDGAPTGAEEDAADAEELDGQTPTGSGGSLWRRSFGRQRGTSPELTPEARKRRLAYAGGGALVALVTAGLGVRWWRHRR